MSHIQDAAALERVLQRASEATPADLWRVLSSARRQQGMLAALQHAPGPAVKERATDALIAGLKGFRPTVIASWSNMEIARHVPRLARPPKSLITDVVCALYINVDASIQCRFLDELGIPHDAGIVDLPEPAAEPSDIERAASVLLAERDRTPEVMLYLLGLAVLFKEHWPRLAEHLETAFVDEPSPAEEEQPSVASSAGAEEEDDGEIALDLTDQLQARVRLSALDNALIAMAVEAKAGGEKSHDLRQMDEIVRQYVRLQPRRHASFYHLGYVDGLFERPVAERLPADNDLRRAWYHAGWVAGRARERDYAAIVALYDADGRVRSLGGGGPGTEYAASPIATALAESGRHAEAADFLTPLAFLVSDVELALGTLERASALLRQERASEAKPYLYQLEDGLLLRGRAGLSTPPGLLSDTQRRIAHCLRHEKLFVESRRKLVEQLDGALEPRFRAMVLADIALMDSGHHRLSAIDLPTDRTVRLDLLEALTRTEAQFREVAEIDVPERAHGRYVLGVLALLRGHFEEALGHFEFSVTVFEASRDRYRAGGLIEKARFFAGVAGLSMAGHALRVRQFMEWFVSGVKDGLRLPPELMPGVLTGAMLKQDRVAVELIEALMRTQLDDVMSVVVDLEDIRGAERIVADAIFTRHGALKKFEHKDAALLRRGLSLARSAGDDGLAERMLSALLDLAFEGIGRDVALELLSSAEELSGLWDTDDRANAIVTLHERAGEYTEAALRLQDVIHRILSGAQYDYLDQAEDLLSRMVAYGEPGRTVAEGLRDRIEACRAAIIAPASATVSSPGSRITVAIVGGNEVQKRYEASLRSWADDPARNVTLHFIFSGWSSNWNKPLAEFERLRESLDGVVVLRFTRTEFGRAVRKRCNGQAMMGTWGHGEQSLRLAVERVAGIARRQVEAIANGGST